MERENFKSRLGFILVSAGCAIGIGNVWKFPYITGQNGGGLFVLFYLLFLLIMGAPILTMELAVGRASRKSAVQAYKTLEPKGTKWHIHGWVCFIANLMLMMYYTTVSGWMVNYMIKFATGRFDSVSSENTVSQIFEQMLASPKQAMFFMILTVSFGIAVCAMGLQKGIENITKFMMIALIVLIIILAVNSATLSGAAEGIRFYLLPDLKSVKKAGLGKVITAAMNQSFFTLSLGAASMEIFGSYMHKDKALVGESLRICALDTLIAILSGLIIFPACFSYGIETTAGPSLIFITLPEIFIHMKLGRLWGTLFFVFMTFASFSTVIAVFENIIAVGIDNFGWSRKKSSLINYIILLITCTPCALGYNILKGVTIIGDKDILDSEDFFVSNLFLPIGAIIFLLFCVTKWGWGFDKYQAEVNVGEGIKLPSFFKHYFRIVLPVLIFILFLTGLMPSK